MNAFETLVLSPASDRACINIVINSDNIIENQESFLVRLTSSDQFVLPTINVAEVFIQDSTSKQLVLSLHGVC